MARIDPIHATLRDGGKVLLRCPAPEDAEALDAFTAHMNETSEHNVTQPGERRRTLSQTRERFAKAIDDPVSIDILAVAPGSSQILGMVNFKGNEQSRIRHWGMLGLGIHAAHRSRGLGTLLLQTLIDWARSHPTIERVGLQVFETNRPARALYARMGFREECRRERYIKLENGTYLTDIEMSVWVK
jgi:RimJ/RimL family protein N-acetyltransferase